MYTPFYQKLIVGDRELSPTTVSDTQQVDTAITKQPDLVEREPSRDSMEPDAPSVHEDTIRQYENIEQAQETKTIRIENRFVKAVISNEKGGSITRWELKNYRDYSGEGNVNLIDGNGLNLELTNIDGKPFSLNNYAMFTNEMGDQNIFLDERNPVREVEFFLPVKNGRIVKKMIFYHDKYSVDVVVRFENLHDYVINRRYFFGWENGLRATEQNVDEDYSYARAYVSMAGELEDLDVSKTKREEKSFNGVVDWASVRTKYFLASIIPRQPQRMNGAIIEGIGENEEGHIRKIYSIALDVPFSATASQTDTFTTYLGPMDYGILKSYERDLQALIMSKDWYERIFRPIALLILPVLKFMHSFIPNYGVVIIIFSILIKLVLHPLTKKSYQSMSEMQHFQPKIAELREKYKNDPQRMQKEMMKFYKEHGINPLGGCLPMLLQMPLLVALFIVFRSTIQLRGQPFVLWIDDLSRPDDLFIGVSLPLLGDTIHVLPILMGLTMIWQSKMTITDPKQKIMAYFMPIFLVFIFYSFPSGLNLYYSLFNLFSMVQTRMIKKKLHPGDNSEPNKSASKKPLPKETKKEAKKGRK